MTTYEEKRQARIERLQRAAANARGRSNAAFQKVHDMCEIMGGEPVHAGHHSEGKHLRDLDAVDRTMHNACTESDKAKELSYRASAAVCNTAISSDDPDAIAKLKVKIITLERLQETYKQVKKILKNNPTVQALMELGFREPVAIELIKAGKVPQYVTANNNGRLKQARERLVELEAIKDDVTTTIEINGVDIVDNVEENRVQILFPGKPAADMIKKLRSNGFVWCPSSMAWQRKRSSHAMYLAKEILK